MDGEIETLLGLYKEGKISKERFIAYAPAGIPKDTLSDLISDYDAGLISDEDFISIARGMAAVPGVAPPPVIDLLEQWNIFERTKKKFITVKRMDTYRFRIRPFLVWLTQRGINAWDVRDSTVMEYIEEREREREAEYMPSTIQAIRREIKIFFEWLAGEFDRDSPLRRMKIKKIKGSPDTFHIKVEHGKLVFSEMNPIYEALYEHPDKFRDWRRIELGIRLMRETGLRTEHARLLQFRDISFDVAGYIAETGITCGGLIGYSRIKPYERPPKNMPFISTPISVLFAKRIKDYFKIHPEVKADEDLFGIGRRDFQKALKRLRVWAGVSYQVYPKKFRKAFATLLVNIEPSAGLWKQLTGDRIDTLSDYYADETLVLTYKGMGLKGYNDIVNLIFGAEGLLEEEIPPKRPVGRPRKKQAFILPE